MRPRHLAGIGSLLLLACGTSTGETVTPTDAPPAAGAQAPMVAGPAPVLDAEIVRTAAAAAKVERLELRLAADGTVEKQSLYHFEAADIPKVVRDKATEKFPGGTVVRYETEWYAGVGRVFEVEVDTADGKHCEVAALPDGTEQYVECRVEASELPSAVAKTVHDIAGDGKIVEAEKKTRPDGEEYSVEIETAGGELYLYIAPDGTLDGKYRRVPALVEIPIP